MRKKNTEKIDDILGQVLRQNNLNEKLFETRVLNSWETVLGKTINSYTTKKYFKSGTLYVSISSSILRHELFLEREKIKNALNKQVNSEIVKNIIFQ